MQAVITRLAHLCLTKINIYICVESTFFSGYLIHEENPIDRIVSAEISCNDVKLRKYVNAGGGFGSNILGNSTGTLGFGMQVVCSEQV